MQKFQWFRKQILIQTVRNLIHIDTQMRLAKLGSEAANAPKVTKQQLLEYVSLSGPPNIAWIKGLKEMPKEDLAPIHEQIKAFNLMTPSRTAIKLLLKAYRARHPLAMFCLFALYVLVVAALIIEQVEHTKSQRSEDFGFFGLMSILRSEVGQRVAPESINVRFADVIGCDEAIGELAEICDFLKFPDKYVQKGLYLPKGVLLSGPPGTGKTLLARALAGETKAAFFSCNGSEFDQSIVGLGAKRIRNLFKNAKAHAPSIIFIDEIDAIGAKRSPHVHSVYRQAINQILTEMDGFESSAKIIVIGATNFAESLDPALVRSGRFDKTISMTAPDMLARKKLLDFYLKKVKHSMFVDSEAYAKRMIGMTGADIKNFVNIAALQAAKNSKKHVTDEELDFAYDRVQMGIRSAMGTKDFSDYEKKAIAIHETGHSLIAILTNGMADLHKVTILPAGPSLGHTALIPKEETLSYTKENLLKQIDINLGGRAAEEIFLGREKITTGCGDDLRKATEVLYSYVRQFGMEEDTFLGNKDKGELSDSKNYEIDKKVESILKARYQRVKDMLTAHTQLFNVIVEELVAKETLTKEDVDALIKSVNKA